MDIYSKEPLQRKSGSMVSGVKVLGFKPQLHHLLII